MAITINTAAQMPSTGTDGPPISNFGEMYANTCGFRDNNAASNHQQVLVVRSMPDTGTSNTIWLATSTNGASWSYVSLSVLGAFYVLHAATQGADGAVHVVTQADNLSGALTYTRFTLTYTAGNISGATQVASFVLDDGTAGDSYRCAIQECDALDTSKRIVALVGYGDTGTSMVLRMGSFPATATTAAAITGIDGTGTWTTISSGMNNGHDHAGLFTQNLSNKNLIIALGYTSAEFPVEAVKLCYLTPSGATSWSVGAINAMTPAEACIDGMYAVGSNVYLAQLASFTSPALHIHKIDASGAITYDAFPSFVTASNSGWAMIAIDETETIAYAAVTEYIGNYYAGYCVGGTWTTQTANVTDSYTMGGFGHARGLFVYASGETVGSVMPLKAFGVWNDASEVSGSTGTGASVFSSVTVTGSGSVTHSGSGSLSLSSLAFANTGANTQTWTNGHRSAILDFGDGNTAAQTVVTGQTGIASGAKVEAWIQGDNTAGNNSDNHAIAAAYTKFPCGDIVPGTGFTICGVDRSGGITGELIVHFDWSNP